MSKQEIKEAMECLVDDTIKGAIYEDCRVTTKKQYEFAIDVLVKLLQKERSNFEFETEED